MNDLARAMQEASDYLDRHGEGPRHFVKKKEVVTGTQAPAVGNKPNRAQGDPAVILAYGLVLVLAIVAGGYATRWVVPALGAGFGIATRIIAGGIVASGSDFSWVIPAGAAGLASVGGVAVIMLLLRLAKAAAGQPYLCVLPLLAVLAGFCVDMCEDFYPSFPLVRIAYGSVTSATFVLAGLWWKKYGLLNKLAGTLLILLSPLLMLAHGVSGSIDRGLGTALNNVPAKTWTALGGLMTIVILTGLLAFTLENEINK
ncbi:MAG: hypothetical protein JSU72_16325 [Deltaproteobacteria bacterium]|nr:MAG: hypothetical protein JSU72_16325 [Deltaproteobacteria bacterium]